MICVMLYFSKRFQQSYFSKFYFLESDSDNRTFQNAISRKQFRQIELYKTFPKFFVGQYMPSNSSENREIKKLDIIFLILLSSEFQTASF